MIWKRAGVVLCLLAGVWGCGDRDSPGTSTEDAASLVSRAEAGDAEAQFELAERLEHGEGVVQDLVSAHAYYNLAAARGIEGAGAARDRIEARLSSDEAAEARKLALSWKPTAPGAEGSAEAAPSQAPATPEALLAAAHAGDVGAVKALLDQGADPNQPDAQGWTALLVAAMGGHIEMVQLLLGNGADVNARSPDGATPLHAAIAGGKAVVVEELLKAGADREAAANGVTPVMLAQQSQDPQIRELVGAATPPQPAAPAPPKITPMDAPYAALGAANVRRGPEKEFPVVAKLSQGEVVKVTGRVEGNGWLQVLTAAGTVGYVHPSLVVPEAEAAHRVATARQPTQVPPEASYPESGAGASGAGGISAGPKCPELQNEGIRRFNQWDAQMGCSRAGLHICESYICNLETFRVMDWVVSQCPAASAADRKTAASALRDAVSQTRQACRESGYTGKMPIP